MSFFGINFGGGGEIDIILEDADNRKMAEVKDENGRKERFFLYYDGETVSGKVNVTLHRKTGRLEPTASRSSSWARSSSTTTVATTTSFFPW